MRQVRVVEQFETFQNVGSATHDGILFLEGRARALAERLQQEAGSMVRRRDEMTAAASMTATQRHELQVRVREPEVFEFTLREQVESNRELPYHGSV